ncbi:MAG: DUF4139 domain-containing protein [Candidatus Sumerlaeia bacterium]|nr:DUF4139 domain-containing protein [Candidatus Sumerlaeia bacterium]
MTAHSPNWRKGAGVAAAVMAATMLAFPPAAPARIDLVTLPGRDATMITVYNSEDITLVREQRTLSFSEGRNQIQFSWANTLIDPTSLRLEFPGSSNLTMVEAVHPPNVSDLVMCNIDATGDTVGEVEISYFISGLTWSARYHVHVNEDETAFDLQQYTTVKNDSGEDFDNTSVRVVVGEINLVEKIADLARRGILKEDAMRRVLRERAAPEALFAMDMAAMEPSTRREAREIVQQAISEYKLYTVDGEVDIRNGWGQRLPSRPIGEIPFDLSYEIDTRNAGGTPMKVYRLRNTTAHELGIDALPEGEWYVVAEDGREGLRYEGSTRHDYVPVGDDIELNLGPDGLVLFEQRLMDQKRPDIEFDNDGNPVGWTLEEVHHLEVRNTRDQTVPVKLTFNKPGSWELISSSMDAQAIDQRTLRWEMDIPATETVTIELKTLSRHGTKQGNEPPIRPMGGPQR